MDVTLYSPAAPCSSCLVTKLALKKAGIPFVAVVADDEQIQRFKDDGHMQFPVVVVDCGDGATWTWSGYRHEDILRLRDLMQETPRLAA
ncbi:hypothetical protein CG716_05490 [Mycolicibacterium sphagni]|uniref:NrdH-redoxin n=1 Tax=Mycolicibacterium sphagni TaxID=1786 RepID=A0A255DWY8_9MYCO|nr:hypothetical protein CG716_05490 [Mycolicibacterium sphagni]